MFILCLFFRHKITVTSLGELHEQFVEGGRGRGGDQCQFKPILENSRLGQRDYFLSSLLLPELVPGTNLVTNRQVIGEVNNYGLELF